MCDVCEYMWNVSVIRLYECAYMIWVCVHVPVCDCVSVFVWGERVRMSTCYVCVTVSICGSRVYFVSVVCLFLLYLCVWFMSVLLCLLLCLCMVYVYLVSVWSVCQWFVCYSVLCLCGLCVLLCLCMVSVSV